MACPEDTSRSHLHDRSQRFLFEHADIRGESVHLDSSYLELLNIHQYAHGVSRLLGEILAAAVLLSANLKFKGRLILQVRSEGELPLLMAECNHDLQVRGIARGAEQATATADEQLLHNGHMVVTIDPVHGQRYQGIVPLLRGSLAQSLDAYFAQSEQLKTRIWLAADNQRAGGFLLQQLPAQITRDETLRLEQWNWACTSTATVQNEELLALSSERLLYRLFHEEPIRLFEPSPIRFHCTCSRERTRNALRLLDPQDVAELLDELGSISMECEFCSQAYCFHRTDLTDILPENLSKTLH